MQHPLRTLTTVYEMRLIIYANDFERMRVFYQDVLGFPVRTSWDRGPRHKGVMFDTGAGVIELMTPAEERRPFAGTSVSIGVPDVWRLWEELHTNVNVCETLHDTPWGDTAFALLDPEGFRLTFFTEHSKLDKRREWRQHKAQDS